MAYFRYNWNFVGICVIVLCHSSLCAGFLWWTHEIEEDNQENPGCHCPDRINFTAKEQSGIIKSPQDKKSHQYCENMACRWYIERVEGQGIEINFDWFFTESEFDFVEFLFHDKRSGTQQSLTKLSGWWDSENLHRYSFRDDGDIELVFQSDYGENYYGFEAKFQRFDLKDTTKCQCSNVVCEIKPGEWRKITSPNYPKSHCDLTKCFYLLKTEQHHDILLKFEDFNLEVYDYLEIFDGNETDTYQGLNQLLAKLTGSTTFGTMQTSYRTSTNQMFLVLTSDIETSSKGFQAQVTAETQGCACPNKNFTGDTGVIVSPGADKGVYCRDITCIYNISVPQGKVVQLEFSTLELDTVGRADYMELFYPAMNTEEDCIISWRGTQRITENGRLIFTAESNSIRLRYNADKRSQNHQGFLKGFNLTYTAITRPQECACGPLFSGDKLPVIKAINGTIKAPGCAPVDCIFVLDPVDITPDELFKFSLNTLNVKGSRDFLKMFLYRYRYQMDSALVRTYRHGKEIDIKNDFINTHTNEIMVHYHTEGSLADRSEANGFQMIYSWKKQDCNCSVKNLTALGSRQFLTSPGYPGAYCSDMRCEWTVVAESGQVVVEIHDLKLEHGMDILSLFDGDITGDKNQINSQITLIQRFTGVLANFPIRILNSTGKYMSLVLETDYYGEDRGFNLSYYSALPGQTLPLVPLPPIEVSGAATQPTKSPTTTTTSQRITTLSSTKPTTTTTMTTTATVPSSSTGVTAEAGEQIGEKLREHKSKAPAVILTIFLVAVLIVLVVLGVYYARKKGYLQKAREASVIVWSRNPLSTTISSNAQGSGGNPNYSQFADEPIVS